MSRRVTIAAALGLALFGAATLGLEKAGRLALWDERALEEDRIDFSWELDLMMLAEDGRWSGVDFQSPRGPVFQLLAWLPSAVGGPTVAHRILGAEALFQVTCVVLAVLIAWVWVRPGPRRLLAAVVLATLAFGAGIETIRALASALVVLLYGSLETRCRRHPWRGAFVVAGALTFAAMLSFERWLLGAVAIGAMYLVSLAGPGRARARITLVRVVAALGAVLTVLALFQWLAGGSPVGYVTGAWQTGVSYASTRSVPWVAQRVTPAMVAVFLVLGLTLGAVWARGGPRRRRYAQWIAGASCFAAFAVFRPYPGQIFMALLPLVITLLLIACAEARRPRTRWALPLPRALGGVIAAVLTTVFVVGWFALYPESLWWRPTVAWSGVEALRGDTTPDDEYVTEIGHAARWIEAHDAAGCFGAYAGGTALYAMVNGDGPTRGRMRWVQGGPARIAAAIEERACPYHVQFLYSADRAHVAALAFGEDFLTLAESYRALERIAPTLWGFARRDDPLPAERRPVLLSPALRDRELALEETVSLALSEPVQGHEIVRVRYRLEPGSIFPPPLVNVPRIMVRFTHEGEPLGDWQPIYEHEFGVDTSFLASPDPEAAERRFLLERSTYRQQVADGIELKVVGMGWRSAQTARLSLNAAEVLTHPRVLTEHRSQCDRRRRLLDDLRQGRALTRNVSPRDRGEPGFDMFANQPLRAPPEVMFPVRACPGACLEAELEVMMTDGHAVGDGVSWEVHVIDRENRALVHTEPMAPGMSNALRVPLQDFAARPVLLRFGVQSGAHEEGDRARVTNPRIVPCEPPEDPFLDPAVLPRAAQWSERGLPSEMAVAAEHARTLVENPGECVAVRPALDDLARVQELAEGIDFVAWQTDGVHSVGGPDALGCPHLVYQMGSFDDPARAAQQITRYWRVEVYHFEPVVQLGPSLWALRQREDPPRLEGRRVELAGEGPSVTLAEPMPADRLLELRYEMACEGELPSEVTVSLHAGEGELPVTSLPQPVRIDWSHIGSFFLTGDPRAVERRWVSWREAPGATLAGVSVQLPEGCTITWERALVYDPPGEVRAPAECTARVELGAEDGWPRYVDASRGDDGLSLRTTDGDGGLPEVFFPVSLCEGACLDVALHGPVAGDVGVEVHSIHHAMRPRVLHETVAAGQVLEQQLPLPAGEGMVRFGLEPGDGEAAARIGHARIVPCEQEAP